MRAGRSAACTGPRPARARGPRARPSRPPAPLAGTPSTRAARARTARRGRRRSLHGAGSSRHVLRELVLLARRELARVDAGQTRRPARGGRLDPAQRPQARHGEGEAAGRSVMAVLSGFAPDCDVPARRAHRTGRRADGARGRPRADARGDPELGVDALLERLVVLHVELAPVHVDRRRALELEVVLELVVLREPVLRGGRLHVRLALGHVELEDLRVPLEVRLLEVVLPLEEQVLHLPELALLARRPCGARGRLGVHVHRQHDELVDEADLVRVRGERLRRPSARPRGSAGTRSPRTRRL